jgi:hypothetical protein
MSTPLPCRYPSFGICGRLHHRDAEVEYLGRSGGRPRPGRHRPNRLRAEGHSPDLDDAHGIVLDEVEIPEVYGNPAADGEVDLAVGSKGSLS